jgi:hypothetical protein
MLIDLDNVLLSPNVMNGYLGEIDARLRPTTAMLQKMGGDKLSFGIEYLVSRTDGGAWIAVDICLQGAHLLTMIYSVPPGEWCHAQKAASA